MLQCFGLYHEYLQERAKERETTLLCKQAILTGDFVKSSKRMSYHILSRMPAQLIIMTFECLRLMMKAVDEVLAKASRNACVCLALETNCSNLAWVFARFRPPIACGCGLLVEPIHEFGFKISSYKLVWC